MTLYATTADINAANARLARIEKAITTLAWWLVEAQTGFGEQDARGIDAILKGEQAQGEKNESTS